MRFAIIACIVYISAAPMSARDDWPHWRGPTLDGVSTCTGLPTEWSESKNIVWKVRLPSWSAATPIVTGDHIFVMSPSEVQADESDADQRSSRRAKRANPGGSDILLLCLRKCDGVLLWTRKLGDANQLYYKQNMASPSPVTDGKHVWALTGTGVLAAFDLNGKQSWRCNPQERYGAFGLKYGYASSPLLYENLIIVQVLHGTDATGPSYLVAFDKVSGEVVWYHERRTDAINECPDAYTTPTISTHGGRRDLIVSGADYITGHDPRTGREIWRAGGLNPEQQGNYRICGSPVPAGDFIIAPSRVTPVLAVRAGGAGNVTESHFAWKLTKGGPDVPTPVSDGRHVYVVNDSGLVSCVELESGEVVWGPQRTARGTVSASPLLADGKLYITTESAVTTVLKAGPEFAVLATNQLDDNYTLASMATSGKHIFIRTSMHLYCIGEPDP
jgi:outer membrane protein assembly factor BamB